MPLSDLDSDPSDSNWDDYNILEPLDVTPDPILDPRWHAASANEVFLTRLPPVDWLIKPLHLAKGRPLGLWGAPGSGKNILAQTWALVVASGVAIGPWVPFTPKPRRVLHITYDMGKYATAIRYRQLANGMELEWEEINGQLTIAAHPEIDLTDEKALSHFTKVLTTYDLCILDNLRAATFGVDENSSEFGSTLTLFGAAGQAANCVTMYLHHTKKGASPGIDAARGTGATLGASGAIWMIGEAQGDAPRKLHHLRAHDTALGLESDAWVSLRNATHGVPNYSLPPGMPTHLWLEVSDKAPAKPRKGKATESSQDEDSDFHGAKATAIIELVTTHPEISFSGIYDSVGGKKSTLVEIVKGLVTAGVLQKVERPSGQHAYSVVPAQIAGNRSQAVP
jgi:hypothetical protein